MSSLDSWLSSESSAVSDESRSFDWEKFEKKKDYSKFVIQFFDQNGDLSGEASLMLRPFNAPDLRGVRSKNGLDLHIESITSTNMPSGFSDKFISASIEFLKFNDHPKSRISLKATTYSRQGKIGAYVWGPVGFEYIPDSGDESQSKKMNGLFYEWIKKKAYFESLPQSAQVKIQERIFSFKYPWEIAQYDLSSDINVGGIPLGKYKERIGKEFLTETGDSTDDLYWNGALYFNEPNSPGMKQYLKKKK